MARKKLVNVGEVVVEDEIDTATLEDVMATAHAAATAGDPDPNETQGGNPEGEEEEQEEAANLSDNEREKQLKREKNALLKKVAKTGEAYGAGKTSMISLAEDVTEAAMSGCIGPKDAEAIYDRFKKGADDKATLDDAGVVPDAALSDKPDTVSPEKSKQQQVSKVRAFIKLGNEFEDDAATIIRTARNVYLRMLDGDRKALKKGSAYNILKDVATEQMSKERKGVPMDESEIEAYLTVEVSEAAPATGAKKIEDALNSARAAQRGSVTTGRTPIVNDNLDLAIEHLRQALAEIAPDRLAEVDAKHAKGEEKDVATVTEPQAAA